LEVTSEVIQGKSIGIGAAAASMMRGNGGQLKEYIPQVTKMTSGTTGTGESTVTSTLNSVITEQQDTQNEIEQYS
jgi:hypothetical protein